MSKMCLRTLAGIAIVAAAVGISACSEQQPSVDQLVSKAREAFTADRRSEAEKLYREVARRAPGNAEAQRQLGVIYFEQGQVIRSFPLLQQAAKSEPDNIEIKLKVGLVFLMFGQFQQAAEAAQEILNKQPGHEEALLLLAGSNATPQSAFETRKLIESLRQQDQPRASYHVALGTIDVRLREWARAENEFKSAISQDPKDAWAYAGLAALNWGRNDPVAANENFRAAMELAPGRSPIPLRYAEFLLTTGRNDEAKALLEDLAKKTPDYLPPRVFLMRLACRVKRDDDCAAQVKAILAQDSTNFDALFEQGALSLIQGDAPAAVRTFEYLAKIFTRNPQVHLQLGLAYLLQARKSSEADARAATDSAERHLTEAVQIDPHLEAAVLLLAEIKIRKGAPAAAIAPLTELIKERPQSIRAYYLLATAQLGQQNPSQALAIYLQMMERFPKEHQPPFLAGRILLQQGQLQEARRNFNRANEISPDYLPAVEALINLDIEDRLFSTATERLNRFLEKDPPVATALVLRAKIRLAQKDLKSAEADLVKAIERDPKLESAYLLLAQIYDGTDRPEQALEKLYAAAQHNKSVLALVQVAMIQERQKNYEGARDAYQQLLAIMPNSVLAINNLAVIYSEHLGKPDDALTLARRAREIVPNDPRVLDTLGWILFKRGDYTEARRLLRDGVSKMPQHAELQYHLGMALYMMGDEEPAREALQNAVNAKDDFIGKDDARQRLSLLTTRPTDGSARSTLEAYLKQHPRDPVALARLATILQASGSTDQAVENLERAVSVNPNFGPALRQLAFIYAQRTPNESKTFEVVERARQTYPQDPEIAKTLGIVNYHRSLYPRAVDLLGEARSKLPNDGELLYYLGQAHYQLKQPKECQAVLEQAVASSSPPTKFASEAKRTLEQCTEMLAPPQ